MNICDEAMFLLSGGTSIFDLNRSNLVVCSTYNRLKLIREYVENQLHITDSTLNISIFSNKTGTITWTTWADSTAACGRSFSKIVALDVDKKSELYKSLKPQLDRIVEI